MVVEWTQIRCGIACPWVILQRAKLRIPLDNVSLEGGMKYDCFLSALLVCWLQHRFSLLTMLLSDGNGFKTSTMRLGADVLVFSRSRGIEGTRFYSLPWNMTEVYLITKFVLLSQMQPWHMSIWSNCSKTLLTLIRLVRSNMLNLPLNFS